jgi:signal transduction histidine kinase/CheY-like chemotaxis protein
VLRRIGIRWVVVALTLSIVAPLGLASVISLQRTFRRQLANVNRQNVATARAISVAVDTQVETTTAALDVFGSLHALDVPDLAAFHGLASRLIVKQPEWSAIQLADGEGRVLAVFPAEAPPDSASAGEWASKVVRTGHPLVTPLFELHGTPGHFVTIAGPVVRNGRSLLALGARVKSSAFSQVLRQQQMPPNGVVALVDAANRIIARSTDEDAYVGSIAAAAFADISAHMPEGNWQTTNRAGVPVYSAFSRSAITGMTAALALPKEEVDGPVRRILLMLAAAWAVVLTLGASIAIVVGQVIVRAMQSASSAAMSLARGEAVAVKRSRIAEIDDLSSGLRQAAVTLETRNRERDEASRLKDEFLMTVSHELRTPLTAIYGWSRMLSTGELRPEQKTRALAAIERNAKALEQLVNDLLDVSRVVSGRLRLDVQPVAITDAVNAAIDAIRPAALAKSIDVVVRAAPGELTLSGDATRLQQIVWNLLSNAVRFTPSGGRIDVDIDRRPDRIVVTVRDTGPGIDPVFLPHVFDRFRQGASGTTRDHGGLGLGLAIGRHRGEQHGGAIRAENAAPGPGAVFHASFPLRTAGVRSEVINGGAVARVEGNRPPPRLDGVSVLVADDDLNARELLLEVLETGGAEVRAASSAEDALMILETWAPDVLLSDIEMPGEDGFALMRKARAQWGAQRMAAIALTAHARPEDRLAALEAGFQWHLAKPIDPGELVHVIATLVHERAASELRT